VGVYEELPGGVFGTSGGGSGGGKYVLHRHHVMSDGLVHYPWYTETWRSTMFKRICYRLDIE
jgi:hypothetical protein